MLHPPRSRANPSAVMQAISERLPCINYPALLPSVLGLKMGLMLSVGFASNAYPLHTEHELHQSIGLVLLLCIDSILSGVTEHLQTNWPIRFSTEHQAVSTSVRKPSC